MNIETSHTMRRGHTRRLGDWALRPHRLTYLSYSYGDSELRLSGRNTSRARSPKGHDFNNVEGYSNHEIDKTVRQTRRA